MMRTLVVVACCWIACALSAAGQGPSRESARDLPETNPYTSTADLELGRQLYGGRCGQCHGLDGEGGRGAVLNAGTLRRGSSDRELFLVIRFGIPNTEMPGSFALPQPDVWRIAAYVRQLSRHGTSEPSTGDATAGAIVYQRSGCAACHTIDGKGGFFGPDLSGVGAKRAVRHLRESVVDPNADISLEYRTVSVTDRSGKVVTGIHLNEDEYSVHLRDVSGNLRSFMKRELAQVALPRQSLMPPFAVRSGADVENLVAYLASLQPPPQRKAP